MQALIKIENDLFDIAARLRSVNDSYVLYFNVLTRRYEVHDKSLHGGTLAFVSPYDELDCRTIDYALYTRVQNADKIFCDIDRENNRIDKQNAAKLTEKFMEKNIFKRSDHGRKRSN